MTVAATTVFRARRVITMEPSSPDATAVAVSGDRIVAVGPFEDLRDGGDAIVDETFADAVVCPGFIEQHLHPILGATTLVTEVVADVDGVNPPVGRQCVF
jgi:predicted amidohydrolase YtcJ